MDSIDFHMQDLERKGFIKPITSHEEDDYDYEAAKKAGVKPDPKTGHMPDTYKKPNHMTFSDESMYHGKDGAEGGHWNQLADERWSFTPGKTNLENHSMKDLRKYMKEKEPGNVLGEQHVDNTHHVPLAASALMDGSGIAVDHRIKDSDLGLKGFSAFDTVAKYHEGPELEHMKDLIAGGMKPQEAYEKAHDHATTRESDHVRGKGGEELLEKYKQFWRDGAAIAKEPSDKERHPDAHTTYYNLDKVAALKGTAEGATQDFKSKFEDEEKQIYEDKARMLKEKKHPPREMEFIHTPGMKLDERNWLDKKDIRGI